MVKDPFQADHSDSILTLLPLVTDSSLGMAEGRRGVQLTKSRSFAHTLATKVPGD